MWVHLSQNSNGRQLRRRVRRYDALVLETLEERQLLSATFGPVLASEVREINGSNNNLAHPDWGTVGVEFIRGSEAEYADGISTPAGADRPSAREVSNAIAAQSEVIYNSRGLTDLIWQWGQFLDHDLDLTVAASPAEAFNVSVPTGDAFFDPFGTGTQVISLSRSIYDTDTGLSAGNPREQINSITAYIDGSMIYGSDDARALGLRTLSGGRMRTSDGDLLPFNTTGLPNAGGTSEFLFVAGDIRVNEQIGLMAMQTLWLREHNSWADKFAEEHPTWSDEQLYQAARRVVIAELQAITYNEFLPSLLGLDALGAYQGYDPTVNVGITNEFATAAYRLGHTLLSPDLLRLNNDGTVADEGAISLRDSFFNLGAITTNGIDSLLKGMATQTAQELDSKLVDDVRNFLFGPPGAGGFDLASLNIQRGRDHGLADYNQTRIDYGLSPATSFADITSDPELQAALAAVYGSLENIDLWVGILAEDHLSGGSLGALGTAILVDQFERLRSGDRFWYQNQFRGEELRQLENTTLADVIERNTELTDLQSNVFFNPSVLYYRAPAGREGNLTLSISGDQVQLIDEVIHEVVEQRTLSDVSQVILAGRDGRPDRFEILAETSATDLANIQISGGNGRAKDELMIRGSFGADRLQIAGSTLTLNGHMVEFEALERLRVALQPRVDQWKVTESPGIPVVVVPQPSTRQTTPHSQTPTRPPEPQRPQPNRPGQYFQPGLLGLAQGVQDLQDHDSQGLQTEENPQINGQRTGQNRPGPRRGM